MWGAVYLSPERSAYMYLTNLYTFLIDINPKYVFGDFTNEKIETGKILVNDKKPDDINMQLFDGDIVTVDEKKYTVECKCYKGDEV